MNKKLNENKRNINKKPKKEKAEYIPSVGRAYAFYFLGCFMGSISPVVSLGIIWLFDIQSSVIIAIVIVVPLLASVIFTFVAPYKLGSRKVKPGKNKNEK
ncbi:MAG: hypothetical protein IJ666_07285 [Ruminococcus sp.]|nr:hypothetical protein [Ruminococcus sp.]